MTAAERSGLLLACQSKLRSEILTMPKDQCVSDWLAMAVVNRSLQMLEGIDQALETRFVSAAVQLRSLLDGLLRFSALWRVSDADETVRRMMGGERLDRLKDRGGNRLTDRSLVDELKQTLPWVEAVYEDCAGFAHLSGKHVFNMITGFEGSNRRVDFFIGPTNPNIPEQAKDDVVRWSEEIANALSKALKLWFSRSNDAWF